MPGYSSDQFYNFQRYEKNSSPRRDGDDNANFSYPSPIANPLNVDLKTRKDGARFVQRGFIRGIYPTTLGKVDNTTASTVKQRRLFFQFNPTTLDRSVSMSTTVLNPLLQDPSNLLQPIPGTSDFSFDMLFNREAEVASGTYVDDLFFRRKSSAIIDDLKQYGENTQKSDVSNIGVLADLYVLDSIIGQSITPDMIGFLKSYWKNASDLTQTSYNASSSSASFSFNPDAFGKVAEGNLGNSAFLSPLPIRIVFSSLFMIEGFVTSSSVQFIKFNSAYVPTICKVTLNVRALYIGFAREKAYLSDALETAVASIVEEQKTDAVTVNTLDIELKDGPGYIFKSPEMRISQRDETTGVYSLGRSIETSAGAFFDWYNNTGYDKPEFDIARDKFYFEGNLRTWTSPSFASKFKNEEFKWDFSANLRMYEILSEDNGTFKKGESLLLCDIPITYKNASGLKDNTSTAIAEKAAQKTTEATAQVDRWYAIGPKLRPKVLSKTSTIQMDVEVTATLTLTLKQMGEQTLKYTDMKTLKIGPEDADTKAQWVDTSNGQKQFHLGRGGGSYNKRVTTSGL